MAASLPVVIETTEESITITSDRKHGDVFNKLKSFFSWWVKQHFEKPSNGYVVRSVTELSIIYTFEKKKSHWAITNLTKKAIDEFKQDEGINFELVSEDSDFDTNLMKVKDVLRYNVKVPESNDELVDSPKFELGAKVVFLRFDDTPPKPRDLVFIVDGSRRPRHAKVTRGAWEVRAFRWDPRQKEWRYELYNGDLNVQESVLERRLLPAPKFRVGDKVIERNSTETDFNVINTYEITEVRWLGLGLGSIWKYQVNDTYGPTGFTTEEYLRIAPEFMLGEKVQWQGGRRIGETFEITAVYWSAHTAEDGIWAYTVRGDDEAENGRYNAMGHEMRHLPKFNIGDKVLLKNIIDRTFEVISYNYGQDDQGKGGWIYNLRDENSNSIEKWEHNLRSLPKFKVGDKVVWQLYGNDGDYKVTDLEWYSFAFEWHYKLRRNDGQETGWILEDNLQPDPANVRPQYVDKLTDGEEYEILRIGQTLTLEKFASLGKYYIERRLIYDNFLIDADEVACEMGIAYENVELPVRTNWGSIYCIKYLQEWINMGKKTDPNTGLDIKTIYIMSEDDIKERELLDLEDQIQTLKTEIKKEKRKQKNVKSNERALLLRKKIIRLQQKLKKLPKDKKEHGIAKADRTKINRLYLQLQSELKF